MSLDVPVCRRSRLRLLAADRQTFVGTGSAYPILANILARDIYRLDPSEPRYLNETIVNTADRGSFAGGGGWAGQYVTIRQANTLLQAATTPAPGAFTAAELAAVRGFAQTFKAIAYYRVLEMRDTLGVAFQNEDPTNTTPGDARLQEGHDQLRRSTARFGEHESRGSGRHHLPVVGVSKRNDRFRPGLPQRPELRSVQPGMEGEGRFLPRNGPSESAACTLHYRHHGADPGSGRRRARRGSRIDFPDRHVLRVRASRNGSRTQPVL